MSVARVRESLKNQPIELEADRLVDGLFSALRSESGANGSIPSLVQRNRRERARRRLADAVRSRGAHPIPASMEQELGAIVARWSKKGFEDAFPDADELEIRCAEERAILDAADAGDEEGRLAAAERAHRREIEKRFGSIEIRGLQTSERVHQDLALAYVPLHAEDIVAPRPKAAPKKSRAKTK
ncbi:MAG: hypothetical protein ABI134_35140 [Byssovorax sp.]